MGNIILQPVGNKEARRNYRNTILNSVDLSVIKRYVNPELYNKIEDLYPKGNVYVWGITNGKNNVNKNKWKKIKPGDVSLFARDKKIIKSAVITLTFNNKELAEKLWGKGEDGTWENIYLVDELSGLDIACEKISKIAGYKENYVIRGFSYLNNEKSDKILSALDLFSNTIMEDVSKEEYIRVIKGLVKEEDLDSQVNGTSRKEQSYLRKILFGEKKTYKCGVCGKEYPIDLLITAHIKKRAECTTEERLDAEHIVMPMCKFGCDDLYEKGYILVEDGTFKKNSNKYLTRYVEEYMNMIEDKPCGYWNEKTMKYFEAHNRKFKDDEI